MYPSMSQAVGSRGRGLIAQLAFVTWWSHWNERCGVPTSSARGRWVRLEAIYTEFWYQCASLRAQLVKNPPAMQETWVRSLGWEDPLEKGLLGEFLTTLFQFTNSLIDSDLEFVPAIDFSFKSYFCFCLFCLLNGYYSLFILLKEWHLHWETGNSMKWQM